MTASGNPCYKCYVFCQVPETATLCQNPGMSALVVLFGFCCYCSFVWGFFCFVFFFANNLIPNLRVLWMLWEFRSSFCKDGKSNAIINVS